MYEGMFQEFPELYHRQEVVGALLTHAGAGSVAETDSSLAALSTLACAPPDDRYVMRGYPVSCFPLSPLNIPASLNGNGRFLYSHVFLLSL